MTPLIILNEGEMYFTGFSEEDKLNFSSKKKDAKIYRGSMTQIREDLKKLSHHPNLGDLIVRQW